MSGIIIGVVVGVAIGLLSIYMLNKSVYLLGQGGRFSYLRALLLYLGRLAIYIVTLVLAWLYLHLHPAALLAGILMTDAGYLLRGYFRLSDRKREGGRR